MQVPVVLPARTWKVLYCPSPEPTEGYPLEGIAHNLAQVHSPHTGGGVIADGTGMGKTLLVTLFLLLFIQRLQKAGTDRKPYLLLCPLLAVLTQWLWAFNTSAPEIEVLVFYGERALSAQKRKSNWISFPLSRLGKKGASKWPQSLRYAWKAQVCIGQKRSQNFQHRHFSNLWHTGDPNSR